MGNIIKGETGEQNAERFIATVRIMAESERYVIMYAMPGGPRGEPHRNDWPWMANKDWRSKVVRAISASGTVWNPSFTPPDSIDGWTFFATSRMPRPRAEFTPIDETLDPVDGGRSRIPVKAFAWIALGLLTIAFLYAVLRNPADASPVALPPSLDGAP